MKRIAIIAALMLASVGSAFAGTIAERVKVENGYVLKLQLSDEKADAYTRCKFGKLAGRITATEIDNPNSTVRVSVGCWIVNRDGSVEYSAFDERRGDYSYVKIDAGLFDRLRGFTEWGNYMGPFMVSDIK